MKNQAPEQKKALGHDNISNTDLRNLPLNAITLNENHTCICCISFPLLPQNMVGSKCNIHIKTQQESILSKGQAAS
jgi:hypothetical protein